MRVRFWLIASVVLNLILAAGWFSQRNSKPHAPLKVVPPKNFNPFETHFKTNVVVRRQNFTWHEVESGDYVTYIKNLREIGCPESTIRDIIVADVDELFAHRRQTEIVSPEHQWWRTDPDLDLTQTAAEKIGSLEAEKKTLLTRLLGPDWETAGDYPVLLPRNGINLNGPVLGELSPEKKQLVFGITDRAQEAMVALQKKARAEKEKVNPIDLARIRQQTRTDLAKILTPAQLEEFLLRHSQTANNLREAFRGLDPTPEEFRAVFRARDPIEQQTDLLSDTPEQSRLRADLTAKLNDAMRQTMGEERYNIFRNNQDPLFREARDLATQIGVPPATVTPIYQINQAVMAEQNRIANDTTLTLEEKVTALAATQLEKAKSLEKLLGTDAYRRLLTEESAPK